MSAIEDAGPSYPVPAIRVTYTVSCGPSHLGRQLGFETMVEQTIAAEDFDELVDRMTHVANRQQAMLELVEHERQLMILVKQLENTARDLVARTEEYRVRAEESNPGRRVVRLNAQDRANLDQLRKQKEELESQIAMRRESIERCRELIGLPPTGLMAAE